VQQRGEFQVLAVEPDRGVREQVGVAIAAVCVLDREAGVADMRVDRSEHIGRIEGLHPFGPVAGGRGGFALQSDRSVGADQGTVV
jgi:hypothetical protein